MLRVPKRGGEFGPPPHKIQPIYNKERSVKVSKSFLLTMLLFSGASIWAQDSKMPQEQKIAPAAAGAPTMEMEKLPAGSKVFVAPMVGGFETYVIAGLQQKKVPLVIVADRSKAEFEISGIAESEKAGWAKMLFMGSQSSAEQASIKIMNLQSGTMVFAYSVNKGSSARGKQSAGEACAKHIKEKIEGRQ
jgi:hypothetical protein